MGSAISSFAAREIRARMAEQKKTGVQLASVLQCSQQAASRRTTGSVPLTLDDAVRVADWLGLSVLDLLPRRLESRAG